MTDARASRLVHRWRSLVANRQTEGKSPASTAEHIARFESQKIAPMSRDPRRSKKFTRERAREIGDRLGVDWHKVPLEQFRQGLAVELEHRDVTHGNLITTGRIAHAHLSERPDYYTMLRKVERPKARRDAGLDKKALWKGIEKDLRAKDRAKVAALRHELKVATAEESATKKSLRARCHAARLAARARAKRIQERARKAANAIRLELGEQRTRVKGACAVGTRASTIADRRAALRAERKHQADLRRIERGTRARKPSIRKTTAEARGESDDEVRDNIPSDLIPLFNRVRRSIKAGPRMSRTEAFLKYAEENPDEAYEGLEDKTDALVADLERQQRAGRRDAVRRRRQS